MFLQDPRRTTRWRRWAVLLMTLPLGACLFHRTPAEPMPTARVAAPAGAATMLVIVLPGRGDDLDGLRESGIAEAIQTARPDADVLLAGATLPYYRQGRVIERLQKLVDDARPRYRQVWMAGASLGGMGTLLYEREHPGALDGLVVFAPYMGGGDLIDEVRKAGGPAQWTPDPRRALADSEPTREEWRVVHDWAVSTPQRTAQVWLVCGRDDRFSEAAQLIAPLLPAGHFLEPAGGHRWTVWRAAATEVFLRAAKAGTPT